MILRIGIIGSGFGLYGLLPAFASQQRCQVVAFFGRQTPRLLKAIEQRKLYYDWQEMLTQESLDAVAIAVPPDAQYLVAKFAIERGLHIFAEKPLAAQLSQAQELLDLATQKKITHGIDFLFPEIDVWRAAKGAIQKQIFGRVKHVTVRWDFLSYDIREKIVSWKTDAKRGGGALSFYASHVLHYLECFTGSIHDLRGEFIYSPESLNGGEVGLELSLQFEKGISGDVHISCNNKEKTRHQVTFFCERGDLILENHNNITEHFTLTYCDGSERKTVVSQDLTFKKSADNDERVLQVKRLAKRFVEACLNNQQMEPSFIAGVRVQELIAMAKKNENKPHTNRPSFSSPLQAKF